MQRILILRGGALGDFIVTLPAIVALRRHVPEAHVELIGNASAASLARSRGVIQRVHSQHESRWAALYSRQPLPSSLRDWLADFDVVVNYWPDPDRALARHFPIRAGQRFISADPTPKHPPAAAHFCGPLSELGVIGTAHFCRIETDRIVLDDPAGPMVAARNGPTIAVHPGSGSPRKNWSADRWIEVVARLPERVLLVLGETERNPWSRLLATSNALKRKTHEHQLTVAAGLPLERLVEELRGCRAFLGHDSGVSHLAAACGIRCVLLFGPTDPAIWAPPAPHVHVIRRSSDLSSISVEDVMNALR